MRPDRRCCSGEPERALVPASPQRAADQCSRFPESLTVHYDLMHVKYLGYVQYLYGNCLQLLTNEIMDQDPLTNLKTLWRFIKNDPKE